LIGVLETIAKILGCIAKPSHRFLNIVLLSKFSNCLSTFLPDGRICLGKKKINFSTVFAGQAVGIKEVHDDIWLVSFMDYDLRYLDLETRVPEPLENPFGSTVLPM